MTQQYGPRTVEDVLDARYWPTEAAYAELAHQQAGRPDGTWGCVCGWIQDKPHREHVADMVAATTPQLTPENGA